MSGWLRNLIGYIFAVSIGLQMLPNKKYEQYVRLFTGLLLILIVIQPVLKIGGVDAFLENKITRFVQEQEVLERDIAEFTKIFSDESGYREETIENIEIQTIEEIRVEVSVDDERHEKRTDTHWNTGDHSDNRGVDSRSGKKEY